jgi:hypothetical protein
MKSRSKQMKIEYLNDETQVRAPDGSLERSTHRDGDPTEKSLLTLIEERAGRAASATPTGAGDSSEACSSEQLKAEDVPDQSDDDRTMMRLGGNGF